MRGVRIDLAIVPIVQADALTVPAVQTGLIVLAPADPIVRVAQTGQIVLGLAGRIVRMCGPTGRAGDLTGLNCGPTDPADVRIVPMYVRTGPTARVPTARMYGRTGLGHVPICLP